MYVKTVNMVNVYIAASKGTFTSKADLHREINTMNKSIYMKLELAVSL